MASQIFNSGDFDFGFWLFAGHWISPKRLTQKGHFSTYSFYLGHFLIAKYIFACLWTGGITVRHVRNHASAA